MNQDQLVHDAKFVWDDGEGETHCTSTYFEIRCLQRVALGKAAEARLERKEDLACEHESKARSFAVRLHDLRRAGHIGRNIRYNEGEFGEAFKTARATNLAVV